MKRKFFYILLLSIIVVICGAFFYRIQMKGGELSGSNNTGSFFISERYGYKVFIPNAWEIDKSNRKNGVDLSLLGPCDSKTGFCSTIVISCQNVEGKQYKTIEDIIPKIKEGLKKFNMNILEENEDSEISGNKAFVVIGKMLRDGVPVLSLNYYTLFNEIFYQIVVALPERNSDFYKKKAHEIVSSFEFLKNE